MRENRIKEDFGLGDLGSGDLDWETSCTARSYTKQTPLLD